MNFEGMSPQQAARAIVREYAFYVEELRPCEDCVLAAIHHFSNKNLVAARRYGYLESIAPFYTKNGNVLDLTEALEAAEKEFPDA